jgi:hypothetical protein
MQISESLMSQEGRKRISFYITIVAMVVVLSSGLTIYFTQQGHSQFTDALSKFNNSSGEQPYQHFGVFAGYDVCKAAITNGANGQVIALESDDRTAHYRGYNDSNVITFSAEVRPRSIPFLSEQRSTYHVSVKCATDAKTNELVNLSWLTSDPYGVK